MNITTGSENPEGCFPHELPHHGASSSWSTQVLVCLNPWLNSEHCRCNGTVGWFIIHVVSPYVCMLWRWCRSGSDGATMSSLFSVILIFVVMYVIASYYVTYYVILYHTFNNPAQDNSKSVLNDSPMSSEYFSAYFVSGWENCQIIMNVLTVPVSKTHSWPDGFWSQLNLKM